MGKLRNIIKTSMSKALGRTADQLDVKTQYVSFDIFDTLVLRNVEKPTDVFNWIDRENAGFFEARVRSEKTARLNATHEDVTLDEIYLNMEKILGHEEAQRLRVLELSTELQMCVPNHEMLQHYNALLSEGRTVLLISDMYLPSDFIVTMLERCGIHGYRGLYISGETGLSMRSGHLFEAVMRENGIKPDQLTHIGDHPVSDYQIPKKLGINAILYKRARYPQFFLQDFCARRGYEITPEMGEDYGILRCVCRNSARGHDVSYLLGNQVLGPMLYGFSCWLHQRVKENNVKDIVFLAREGRLLRDCYTSLYGDGDETIVYINVSRLSLCRALIVNTRSFEELMDLMKSLLRSMELLKEFIELLGIGNQLESIYQETGYDDTTKLDDADRETLYHAIMKYGASYFTKQNRFIKRYLLEKNIKGKRIFLVDVGWAGTMQLKLCELDSDKRYIGNYLCVNNMHSTEDYLNLERHGYWCNSDEWDTRGKVFRFSMSALEEMFMMGEGTTLEYKETTGGIEPVLDAVSINTEINDKIKTIQRGIADFIAFNKGCEWNFDAYVYVFPYMNFAVYPTLRCIETLKGFNFVNGVHKNSVLPAHSMVYYLLHPKCFRDELEANNAKVFWVKAVMKIPLPYFSMLCFMTDKMGMRSEYQKKYVNCSGKEQARKASGRHMEKRNTAT